MQYLYGNPVKEEVVHHFHDTPQQLNPHLIIIMIGYDSASATYIQKKKELLEEIGGQVTVQRFPKKSSEEEIVEYIRTCNADSDVDGIVVQLPVPDKYNKDLFLDTIDAPKDVDGLSAFNLGSLFYGSDKPFFLPATVRAVLHLLDYYAYNVHGSHVVLVGAGLLVNQPLYHILVERGASVTTTHKDTHNLAEITQQGDFIVSATGQPGIITSEHIKENSVLIDVGTRYDNQGRVFGDVDAESISSKAAALTPVPGGVGPLTVAMLIDNTIQSALFNDVLADMMEEMGPM